MRKIVFITLFILKAGWFFAGCTRCTPELKATEQSIILTEKTVAVFEQDKMTVTEPKLPVEKANEFNEAKVTEVHFAPLSGSEGLQHEIIQSANGAKITLFAFDTQKRELFTLPPGNFDYHAPIQYAYGEKPKYACFVYYNADDEAMQLWFVNGESGLAKKILASSKVIRYYMSDDGGALCVYNGADSMFPEMPIVHIYETKALQEIKKIAYEPYRGKWMSLLEMEYKDNAFIVTLGIPMSSIYTILEIPIDETAGYTVLKISEAEEE